MLTDIILEAYGNFNIIFIQESPWSFIHFIPSLVNEKEEQLVETPNYPN